MTEVLVTGGAGYIGSHMSVELLQAGYQVVVLDNFANSTPASLEAVQRITQKRLVSYEADLRDRDRLTEIFGRHQFAAVLHFGGMKSVGESVANPALYYDNNVNGSLRLIECMMHAGVKTMVFSSSATVYGIPEIMPIGEQCPTGPINPYGRSKLHIEEILRDVASADPDWRVSLLRYFNPVGAHPSGEIGEDPQGTPANLVPYVSQVAVGRLPHLNVFGDDYPTHDGTGVRDYIHVLDLVRGHLQALAFLHNTGGVHVHNLGTGQGYSVLDVVKAFEAVSGRKIPLNIADRRPGDAATSYADPQLANDELDWRAKLDLERMCRDVWRWQSQYPQGFQEAS